MDCRSVNASTEDVYIKNDHPRGSQGRNRNKFKERHSMVGVGWGLEEGEGGCTAKLFKRGGGWPDKKKKEGLCMGGAGPPGGRTTKKKGRSEATHSLATAGSSANIVVKVLVGKGWQNKKKTGGAGIFLSRRWWGPEGRNERERSPTQNRYMAIL